MNNIDICVIGRKTADFTAHLTVIRSKEGLKVVKRRNKPFYDITGDITNKSDLTAMAEALQYMLNHCEAEIEIKDDSLRQTILDMVR